VKAWMVISAGHGPPECAWVVWHLGPVFAKAAEKAGLKCEEIARATGPAAETTMSLLYELQDMSDGTALAAFLATWEGTVQWIGRSVLRPNNKRKNWFVKVARVTAAEEGAAALREEDLEESALRSGGAGGQHVNKTSSAVRLRHVPTGLVVVARDERSQAMNRKVARERLAALLASRAEGERAAAERARWGEHNEVERGNARLVFRGPEFAPVR
jgi:peptide chain release factor